MTFSYEQRSKMPSRPCAAKAVTVFSLTLSASGANSPGHVDGSHGEQSLLSGAPTTISARARNPVVLDAMHEAIDKCGSGSGGYAQYLRHHNTYHVELEAELADPIGKEAALAVTSGYVSNEATLETLQRILPNLIIFSDALTTPP